LLAHVPGGMYPELDRPLVLVDRDGRIEELPSIVPGDHNVPRVSPDGRKLVYMQGRQGEMDLWVYDIETETPRQLTFDGPNGVPEWSPDSLTIVFDDYAGTPFYNLHTVAADGTQDPVRLTRGDHNQDAGSWSSEGSLAYRQDGDLWVVPVVEGKAGEERQLTRTPARERAPAFSPGGSWLAFTSDETGDEELYVVPYPGPGERTKISEGGGWNPAWSRDGGELYYRCGDPERPKMMVVEMSDGRPAGEPRLMFEEPFATTIGTRNYDVMADGRFVMALRSRNEPEPVTQINLVTNWFDELKTLVPIRR